MKEVDVLVVGAGPAGSSAAYHLARHGVDVLLIDKARFPREKVCGDGLTPRGVKALLDMGIDPTEAGFVRIDGLRTYGPGIRLDLSWPPVESFPSFGLVRTRHDLDHLLVQQAVKAGAQFAEETEAADPVLDRGWVVGARIRSSDGRLEPVATRFVLACDGSSSRFASRVGIVRDRGRPLGVAARRYFRSPRPQQRFFESWLDLRDGDAVLPGYGWVFPVGDGILNVGAGLLNTFRNFRNVSPRHVYDVFVRTLPPEWEIGEENAVGPLLAGPLPMGMNRRPLAVPGLLLAGDAGGIINPFNGEGIAYAMESGQIAAELLADALARGRPGLAHVYPAVLRARYGRYFSVGRVFVRAIGDPRVMRFLVRHGLPREWLMRFALRLMANITDGPEGDVEDRIMDWIVRVAPER